MEELALSKSSVETFKQCGLKFKYRYIDKILGSQKLEDKQAALFGTLIHSVLERYFGADKKGDLLSLYKEEFKKSEVNKHELYIAGEQLIKGYAADADNGNKILCVEKDFRLYLDNGVPVKGFIDRIDEISPDEIEIIDYKTGYSVPLTEDQLATDLQLAIYTMAAKQLFPEYKKVKASLYYLHYGKVSVYISEENLESIKGYLSVIYDKILQADENSFKPRVNSFCSFCEYKASCSEYKETVMGNDAALTQEYKALMVPDSAVFIELDKIDAFLDVVVAKQKTLKKMEEDIKAFIEEYIKTHGDEQRKVKIGGTSYSLASKKYKQYDPEIVHKVCVELGVNPWTLFKVNKMDVDNAFKGDSAAMAALSKNSKTAFSKSFVR